MQPFSLQYQTIYNYRNIYSIIIASVRLNTKKIFLTYASPETLENFINLSSNHQQVANNVLGAKQH